MSHQNISTPNSLKKLRACTQCHLVKPEDQFIKEGCDNCKSIKLTEISDFITPHFKGIIAITNPKYSWAAKWLKKRKNV